MDLFLENNDYHYELEKLCRLFYPMQRIRVFEKGAAPADPGPDVHHRALSGRDRFRHVSNAAGYVRFRKSVRRRVRRRAHARRFALALFAKGKRLYAAVGHFDRHPARQAAAPPCGALRRGGGGRAPFGRLPCQPPEGCTCPRDAAQRVGRPFEGKGKRLQRVRRHPVLPDALRVLFVRFHNGGKDDALDPRVSRLPVPWEIAAAGAVAKDLGLSVQSVYIGGGTPTTLSASQLSPPACGDPSVRVRSLRVPGIYGRSRPARHRHARKAAGAA